MLASQFHRTLPAIQRGPYPMPPLFSVLLPLARTNYVTNSSFETNTTSWTAIGGSIARSTVQQYHGAYSLAVTPSAGTTDGARYDTVSLTLGTTYAYSAKVLGITGLAYRLCIETTGGSELASVTFTATGRWQWVKGFYTEVSSTTRRVTVRKASHASTAVFYLDGVQVESCADGQLAATTYIDGDQQGLIPNQSPPAYGWNGTPHASTSYRSVQTRAGGMVMRLDYYGFVLLLIAGLGAPTPTNIAQGYVQLDGAAYERTQKGPRQFTLGGRFDAATFPQLQRQISDLTSVLDRDYIATQQPLTLLYQGVDSCDKVTSDTGRIICSYAGGLEGITDNQHAEQTSVVFRQWLPTILSDGEAGIGYGAASAVTNANAILQRSPAGVWSSLGSGLSGGGGPIVYAIAVSPIDGAVYVGGDFALAGGVANTVSIAKWDPTTSTWSALGTGVGSADVRALAVGPDGSLYAGGGFGSMGGVANTRGIAKWNGSAWSALGTGVSVGATTYALCFDAAGNLYAGGDFTAMGGVANTQAIARWNGTTWQSLSATTNVSVMALARYADNLIAVGGTFAAGQGGVASPYAILWNTTTSTWTAMSTGMGNSVLAWAVGPDQRLYAAGTFTTAGGNSANRVAVWNGFSWAPLGSGLGGTAYTLIFRPGGALYVGGSFTTAGGVTVPDAGASWQGGAWTPLDIDLPGTATVPALATKSDGTLYVGFDQTGTGTGGASPTQTINNPGTARAYPTLKITGPTSGTSRIFSLQNYTTGRSIFFNYTINAGETATLVFDPANLSFTSDFVGNITSKILPGSNEADFFLQPGANTVYFQWDNASGVGALLRWRPAFNSYHDLVL